FMHSPRAVAADSTLRRALCAKRAVARGPYRTEDRGIRTRDYIARNTKYATVVFTGTFPFRKMVMLPLPRCTLRTPTGVVAPPCTVATTRLLVFTAGSVIVTL